MAGSAAPSAERMPISRVRRPTWNASIAYSPAAASASETAANATSVCISKRRDDSCASSRRSAVVSDASGSVGSRERSSWRIAGSRASALGRAADRQVHVLEKPRHEHRQDRRSVEPFAPQVADDADDGRPPAVLRRPGPAREPLADRALARPEAARHRVRDDDDRRGARAHVAFVEIPALSQLDGHGAEVARRHRIDHQLGKAPVGISQCAALGGHFLIRGPPDEEVGDAAHAGDARQMRQSILCVEKKRDDTGQSMRTIARPSAR